MTNIAPAINYILPRDKQVEVVVSELKLGKTFPSGKSKHPDGHIRCHYFMAQYSEFPHPVPVQWCNSNESVTEFKNGDKIKILAGLYSNEFMIQSVTWINTIPKENQRTKMEAVANQNTLTSELPQPKGERRVHDAQNLNPSVMGSLWSIASGHAVDFYKDRKDGTPEKVISLLDELLKHYHTTTLGND